MFKIFDIFSSCKCSCVDANNIDIFSQIDIEVIDIEVLSSQQFVNDKSEINIYIEAAVQTNELFNESDIIYIAKIPDNESHYTKKKNHSFALNQEQSVLNEIQINCNSTKTSSSSKLGSIQDQGKINELQFEIFTELNPNQIIEFRPNNIYEKQHYIEGYCQLEEGQYQIVYLKNCINNDNYDYLLEEQNIEGSKQPQLWKVMGKSQIFQLELQEINDHNVSVSVISQKHHSTKAQKKSQILQKSEYNENYINSCSTRKKSQIKQFYQNKRFQFPTHSSSDEQNAFLQQQNLNSYNNGHNINTQYYTEQNLCSDNKENQQENSLSNIKYTYNQNMTIDNINQQGGNNTNNCQPTYSSEGASETIFKLAQIVNSQYARKFKRTKIKRHQVYETQSPKFM